jgi:prepilin-type N-terminal cleavage/methylation domain-containing protein
MAKFLLASAGPGGSLREPFAAQAAAGIQTGARCPNPYITNKNNNPMKAKYKSRHGFTLVELLVVIVIIAALAGLTAPMVIRQRRKADQTEAVSNARQIGLALFEFETDYSSYPDNNTATDVTEQTGSNLSLGNQSSNDYFRQLIAANKTQSERMFYAKIPGVRKPDDNIKVGEALKEGEVGYAYLMKTESTGFSAAGNPGRPLVVTPLMGSATDGTFDPAPFDNKAIILRMDNSVTSINIKQDKTISLSGKNGLLDIGEDTVWGEGATKPTIKAPKTTG